MAKQKGDIGSRITGMVLQLYKTNQRTVPRFSDFVLLLIILQL